jgi:hypothetical protein
MNAPLLPPIYKLFDEWCGNRRHPKGEYHKTRPAARWWQWRQRRQERRNTRRWGCRCDRDASGRPVEDSLPTIKAPRGGIRYYRGDT